MKDQQINFLDTTIYIDESAKIQMKHYRKEISSDVLCNFNKSVKAKHQKIGIITGELHRMNNTCYNAKDLDIAIKKFKN